MRKKQSTTGPKLLKIRQAFGLNQSEFWNAIGVTQSGGSRYESGRAMPKPVRMLVEHCYLGRDAPRHQSPLVAVRARL